MREILVLAAAALVACGSDPKPEPGVAATKPPASASAVPLASAAPSTVASAATDAGKSDKQTDCDTLVDDANSTLDAARIAVDKDCKKDADCMPIKGRACNFACVTGAIPKGEEKDWNDALTKANVSCKKWNDNECSKLRTRPPPTCQDRKLWCEKGHCALK